MKEPQTLQQLLDVAKVRADGASMRQLAFRAKHEGKFKVVDTTLNAIRAGTYKSTPKPDTLRAIAWLAGVDESVAFTAAGQPAPGPPLADELPAGSDNLSPRSRRALIEMARVLIDLESDRDERHDNAQDQAAGTRPDGDPGDVGDSARAGQKIDPAAYDLAAHPVIAIAADRLDAEFDAAGEESQDGGR